MDPDSRASRSVRWARRMALAIPFFVAVTIGPALVILPVMHVVRPDMDLLAQKLMSVTGGWWTVVLLGLGVWLFAAWLRRRLLDLRQGEHDRTAQEVMTELRANPNVPVPDFYLYLRAFETTGRLHVPLFLRLRRISVGLNRLVTDDVESYVSAAIRRIGPLVALGRAGEMIGAGRIATDDENWKADIRVLMNRAKGILVVPSNRPGTLWEIETLKGERLLPKVIFVMPPRSKGEIDTKERWEPARLAMAANGLEAPEHHKRGMLFKVGPDGKVCNLEPMLLTSPRQVRKSLKRLLSTRPPSGGFFKAVAKAERRTRRATFWGWAETIRQLSPYAVAAAGVFLPHPAVGFNPAEPWNLVFSRYMTATSISEYDRASALAGSEKYRALESQVPPDQRADWSSNLQLHGLLRVSDEQARAYYGAFGEMLSRVDLKACAAIVRGDIQPDAMAIALTYMPSDRIDDFLRVGTAAIIAEAEQRPLHVPDAAATELANAQMLEHLGPDGRRRFEQIDQGQVMPTDDDRCWLARVLYGTVTALPQPHATVWARTLAASALPAAPAPPATANGAPASEVTRREPMEPRAEPPQEPTLRQPPRPQQIDANADANLKSVEAPTPTPVSVRPVAAEPPAPASPPAAATPSPRLSYARLIDDATTAIRGGRLAEADEVIDQLIRLDPDRSEGWNLRGIVALNAFGNLAAAREAYENALARGGAVMFRVVHDHSAGQQPCIGAFTVKDSGVTFTADAGDHRFQWPFAAIQEAAINGVYGSQLGMFHIKAQMADGNKNFNFAVVRSTDQQLVNRKPDAELLLRLMNRARSPR